MSIMKERRVFIMILISILLITLILLTVLTVCVVGTIGAAGIVIFGDVIVCGVFIVLLIKWLAKRRKSKRE